MSPLTCLMYRGMLHLQYNLFFQLYRQTVWRSDSFCNVCIVIVHPLYSNGVSCSGCLGPVPSPPPPRRHDDWTTEASLTTPTPTSCVCLCLLGVHVCAYFRMCAMCALLASPKKKGPHTVRVRNSSKCTEGKVPFQKEYRKEGRKSRESKWIKKSERMDIVTSGSQS